MRSALVILLLFLSGCVTVATKKVTISVPGPSGHVSSDKVVETMLARPDVQGALVIVDNVVRRHGLKRLDDAAITEEGCVRRYADGSVQCRICIAEHPLLLTKRHRLFVHFIEVHRLRSSQEVRDMRDEIRAAFAEHFDNNPAK